MNELERSNSAPIEYRRSETDPMTTEQVDPGPKQSLMVESDPRLQEGGEEDQGEQATRIAGCIQAVWVGTSDQIQPHLHQGRGGAEDEKREADAGGQVGQGPEDRMALNPGPA